MEGGLLAMACRAPRLWNADGLPSDLVVSASLFEGTGFLQAAVPVPYQVSLTILQVISAGLFGQGAELHPDALFHLFCCERMSPALRFVLSEKRARTPRRFQRFDPFKYLSPRHRHALKPRSAVAFIDKGL